MLQKNKLFLAVILLFLFLTRFISLDTLPPFLTHDEVVYGIVAKSFAVQGTTLTQDQAWYSMRPVHPFYAELPALFMTPLFWVTDNPLLAVRIPTALMGIVFPFVFGWFCWGIWRDKTLAWIAAVIASLNPLWWQFSRLSYDAVYSTFFYFLGGALFFSNTKRGFLWSIPVFAVGFFQYQGFKLLLVPWLALLTFIWLLQHKKESWKLRIVPLVASVVLLLAYLLFMLPNQDVDGRLEGTLLQDQSVLSEIANDQRRKALQLPIAPLFSNKVTALIQLSADKLLNSFSPHLLFLNSEPSASGFAVWSHGLFYLLDIALLLIGIGALQRKKTRVIGLSFLLALPFFAVPVIINLTSEWYLLRSFFAYTLLLLVISWGAFVWWQSRFRWVLVLLYALSVLNFASQYFVRYPVMGADAGFFQERVLAQYIGWARESYPDEQIVVYTIDPPILFSSYLLHSGSVSQDTVGQISDSFRAGTYTFDNIRFQNTCVDDDDGITLGVTEAIRDRCRALTEFSADANKITIPALKDSGSVYEILNDKVCGQYDLGTFIQVSSLDQFRLHTLSEEVFCKQWITDLKKVT
ncbi:MAG: hypothetical protein O2840_00720 [bacterium]|nr:hypothetical protein [bacterium]